jgi:hypothetical protein
LKEEVSSPTSSMESVLLMAVIEVEERCDVAMADIPKTFIQTRVEHEEDKAIIRVRGYLVDVLCKINPNYKKFVTVKKKGEKQLLLAECNLWHNDCKLAFLQQVRQDFEMEQIQTKPLQSMHYKSNDGWETADLWLPC